MRNWLLFSVVLFISLSLSHSISYSADDDKIKAPSPSQVQYQVPQPNQPSPPRPILPPVAPFPSTGISPTPSPHIASPPVTPGPMTPPHVPTNVKVPKTTIPNIPSVPAHLPVPQIPNVPRIPSIPTMSNVPKIPDIPVVSQIPSVRSLLGTVMNKWSEEDGSQWMEVKSEHFDESQKIKIIPEETVIRQKGHLSGLEDIRVGGMVNVIYIMQDETPTANFISIFTEEDIKTIEESLVDEATERSDDASAVNTEESNR